MKNVGIIGSGQLGKMLIESVKSEDEFSFNVLSPSKECPCKNIANIQIGSLQSDKDITKLSENSEVLTYEIEHINADRLIELEESGKKIIPSPKILKIIQNKCLQKQHYRDNNIPTAPFILSNEFRKIEFEKLIEPLLIFDKLVIKSGKDGYDGKGVEIISTDFSSLLNKFSEGREFVCEGFVKCKKEISVIVIVGNDEIKTYPSVEMVFKEGANLLDYMFCPSSLSDNLEKEAQELAIRTIKSFANIANIRGIYAVELFLDINDQLLVNEIAPRPHNSGHHTIEAFTTSQYTQLIRILYDEELGEIKMIRRSGMINIIGPDDFVGEYTIKNSEEIMNLGEIFIHDYGKMESRPNRKLGHITVLSDTMDDVLKKIEKIKTLLKVSNKNFD